MFIIDSGSSVNVLNDAIANETTHDLLRDTRSKLEFDTANDVVMADHGLRARIAYWDNMSDYTALKESPNLISVGERTMLKGFIHVWCSKKYPCFLSHGSRYIIIFDVDNLTPIWSPDMETSRELLGTFSFWDNIFRERCGVYINENSQI